jgi:hypothetical protein
MQRTSSTEQPFQCPWASRRLYLFAVAWVFMLVRADLLAAEREFTASVFVLKEPEPVMVPAVAVALPETVDPQRDYIRQNDPRPDESDGSLLRYALLLPDRPLVVAVDVTINGQPVSRLRKEFVNQLAEQFSAGDGLNAEAGPASAPAAAGRSESVQRLRQYVETTGRRPDVDEIRWLLEKWQEGPVAWLMRDSFQGRLVG